MSLAGERGILNGTQPSLRLVEGSTVSAEFWIETQKMTTAGLLLVALAVPVALAACALRPKGEPLLPPWKPWQVPWGGAEVTFAFVGVMWVAPMLVYTTLSACHFFTALYGPNFPPLEPHAASEAGREANILRTLWANVLSVPLSVVLLVMLSRAMYPRWKPALMGHGSLAAKVTLAVVAWLVVTPLVLLFHTAVNELFKQFGVVPDQHALTRLGHRPALDQTLFVLEACVGAPLREEFLFRGVLLAWCIGRVQSARPTPLANARPWFVMTATVIFAANEGKSAGPVIFAGVLALGLAAVWRLPHSGVRRVRAVYATAAAFAVIHSSVWPTPIPLFLLALVLGWLAVRTNGVLVPVIVHGMFNAVSAVYTLRG